MAVYKVYMAVYNVYYDGRRKGELGVYKVYIRCI